MLSRKGAITSKIKHALKLKTSPARLTQLLQPSLAFLFQLAANDCVPSSPRRYAVIGCKLKQNAMGAATIVQVLRDLF